MTASAAKRLYLGDHALATPNKAAIVNARTGEALSYAELDRRSRRLAHVLHAAGLQPGDHMALLMENQLRYLEVVWAAFRSGLYITAVNRFLTPDEAAYIVVDCGAKALVSSVAMAETAGPLAGLVPQCDLRLMCRSHR